MKGKNMLIDKIMLFVVVCVGVGCAAALGVGCGAASQPAFCNTIARTSDEAALVLGYIAERDDVPVDVLDATIGTGELIEELWQVCFEEDRS